MSKWKRYMSSLMGLILSVLLLFPPSALASATQPGEEEPPESLSKPEIILSGFTLADGSLMAGKTIKLSFEATNYGQSEAAGLVASYQTNSNALHVVFGQSSRQYIGDIPTGESVRFEKEFALAANVPDIVELALTLEYMSQKTGEYYSSYSVVYLPIVGANSFSANVSVNDMAYAELPMFINGTISNLGNFVMHNVRMVIKSQYTGEIKEETFGDIDAGHQMQFSQSLVYSQAGIADAVEVSFSFEDSSGNSFVMDPMIYPVAVVELSLNGDGEASSLTAPPLWILTALAGVICVAAVLAGYFIKRRRNSSF